MASDKPGHQAIFITVRRAHVGIALALLALSQRGRLRSAHPLRGFGPARTMDGFGQARSSGHLHYGSPEPRRDCARFARAVPEGGASTRSLLRGLGSACTADGFGQARPSCHLHYGSRNHVGIALALLALSQRGMLQREVRFAALGRHVRRMASGKPGHHAIFITVRRNHVGIALALLALSRRGRLRSAHPLRGFGNKGKGRSPSGLGRGLCPCYPAARGRSAEREGFEPPLPLRVKRFSRPPHSTALPPLQKDAGQWAAKLPDAPKRKSPP